MAFNLNDENSNELSEINVTPFIDVMLVLLIIFMVVMPLATVNLPLNLPAISATENKPEGKPIILSLDQNKQLFIEKELIDLADIGQKLDSQTQQNKESIIYLQVDKTVPYDDLMNIMNQLRQAGYLKIGLVGLNKVE